MKGSDHVPLPDAILFQAIETFIELGYEKTSMDEVAARAGTTKRTVYSHHGSKQELFRSALARAVELFLSDLPPLLDTSDPASELESFAVRFNQLCTWRGAVRLQRVAMAEAERFPDIAATLHREVIERIERMVADYLGALLQQQPKHAGNVSGEWRIAMASLFLNMATGRQRFATLLQARAPHPEHPALGTMPDLDSAHIRQAVRFFLAGFASTTASGLGVRPEEAGRVQP